MIISITNGSPTSCYFLWVSLTLVYSLNPASSLLVSPIIHFLFAQCGVNLFPARTQTGGSPVSLKHYERLRKVHVDLREEHTAERWGKSHEKSSDPWRSFSCLRLFHSRGLSMIFCLILWCPCILAFFTLTLPILPDICKYFSWWIFTLYLQFLMFTIFSHPFVFNVQNTNISLKRGSSSQDKHHQKIINLSMPSYILY